MEKYTSLNLLKKIFSSSVILKFSKTLNSYILKLFLVFPNMEYYHFKKFLKIFFKCEKCIHRKNLIFKSYV